jgi:LDH2 family malate/lactate/ureidoglycolate dehydrogenase
LTYSLTESFPEPRFDWRKLLAFCTEAFRAAGCSDEHAKTVADNLMQAELRGVRSHGLLHVKEYIEKLQSGAINKAPRLRVLNETSGALLVDGDHAPGSVSGTFAMDMCVGKAAVTGTASAAVRNGTHFGMAAYYAMRALPRDMIGFAFCSAQPRVAVYGGIDGVMGTNPICAAVPAGSEFPIVYDGATSAITYNRTFLAAREGRVIERGLLLDKDGNDTDDPGALFDGGVFLPFGGYKGSGLAVLVNVLCTLLTGISEDLTNVGFYFAAVDVRVFQEPGLFKRSVDAMVRRMKASRKRGGCEHIYMPGEIEFLNHAEQSKNGVALSESVLSDLVELGLRMEDGVII